MAHLSDIAAASRDTDLRERAVSAAASLGIPQAEALISEGMRTIASRKISPDGQTVADVYAYAVATYAPPPRPGQNAAAVTDEHLLDAVRQAAAIHGRDIPTTDPVA